MKNVLFIVYYFPPMGGSGVQRPLKFVKYLREFGWNPIVICPEPGAYQFFDETFEEELDKLNLEIHRVKGGTLFHIMGGGRKSTGLITGNFAKSLRWISNRIYFPDNKKGWIKPALETAEKILKERKINLVFSTAPPFSNHIIGKRIKDKFGIPLVTDYRDLFVENQFYKRLSESDFRKRKELENSWLEKSDGIAVLDNHAKSIIEKKENYIDLNIKVIPHGFDHEDYSDDLESGLKYQKGKINFLYSGLFYESNQPDIFLKAINELLKERPELKKSIALHFQGGLDSRIVNLIRRFSFDDMVFDYGYVKHDQAVTNLKHADFLWMISNFDKDLQQIKSGKLFEYTGSGKPILGLVYKGEAQSHLDQYGAGFWAEPDDLINIKERIGEIIELWDKNKLPEANNKFISQFNRKKITGDLASFFDEIEGKN